MDPCVIVPAVRHSDCPHIAPVRPQEAGSAILALASVSQVMPSQETTPVAITASDRVVRCGAVGFGTFADIRCRSNAGDFGPYAACQ